MTWPSELKDRLETYLDRQRKVSDASSVLPISIKVRVSSGCFHREHSPNAYAIIDSYRYQNDIGQTELIEHENGPEIIAYIALATASVTFTTAVINFVTAIIKARNDGIKKGDNPKESIELIVRGFDKKGNLKEESILKINSSDKIEGKKIKKLLNDVAKKFVE